MTEFEDIIALTFLYVSYLCVSPLNPVRFDVLVSVLVDLWMGSVLNFT